VPEDGYSVEFFDMTGSTVAVNTVRLLRSARRSPDEALHHLRRQRPSVCLTKLARRLEESIRLQGGP
jgi:hypothetical protein